MGLMDKLRRGVAEVAESEATRRAEEPAAE
jgi:hypothetical protein